MNRHVRMTFSVSCAYDLRVFFSSFNAWNNRCKRHLFISMPLFLSRLSTGALEEACILHDDVLEAAVVGLPDPVKGQVPLAFVVTHKGAFPE